MAALAVVGGLSGCAAPRTVSVPPSQGHITAPAPKPEAAAAVVLGLQVVGWVAPTLRIFLLAALAVAALYPVLKFFEWRWNIAHGLDAGAGIFVIVYWYLTINHFIHASWGLLGMAWCSARLASGGYGARDHRGLQSLAVYWHATDLVWLMLFGLFYAYA